MKILVTGAAGFIGFHLSKKFVEQGHVVVGLDNINDYCDINLKYARLNELGIARHEAETYLNKTTGELFNNSFQFVRMNLEDRETYEFFLKKIILT